MPYWKENAELLGPEAAQDPWRELLRTYLRRNEPEKVAKLAGELEAYLTVHVAAAREAQAALALLLAWDPNAEQSAEQLALADLLPISESEKDQPTSEELEEAQGMAQDAAAQFLSR